MPGIRWNHSEEPGVAELRRGSAVLLALAVAVLGAAPAHAQLLLHVTLDDAASVASPAVGTGVGSSIVTTPADDFVPGFGGAVRIDAAGESVRLAQTSGGTANVDPAIGTLAIRFRPNTFYDDGTRHTIVSTGTWASPGSLHLSKDNASNDNDLSIDYFDAGGAYHSEAVDAKDYGWKPGDDVELRVTWDFGVPPGVQRLRVYQNDVELPLISPDLGPLAMPAASAAEFLYVGARDGGTLFADGLLDELRVWGSVEPPLDTAPPMVALGAPGAGIVSGVVVLEASATDDLGIERVRFEVDGAAIEIDDRQPPYAVAWDTHALPDGVVTLTATAFDVAGNSSVSSGVSVTIDNGDGPSGFFDHFPGDALHARWLALTSGAGSLDVSDSGLECATLAAADACAVVHAGQLERGRSQLWVFAVENRNAAAGAQTWLTVVDSQAPPTAETLASFDPRRRLRMGFDQDGGSEGVVFEYWDDLHAAQRWQRSNAQWTSSTELSHAPLVRDDVVLVGLELDAIGNRWRMLGFTRRSGTGAYSFDQGLRLFEVTDWVSWSDLESSDDLWVVLGDPLTDAEASNLRLEWVRQDGGARHHAWVNGRTSLGNSYVIKHVWGYESANRGVEIFVPQDRTTIAVNKSPNGAWDDGTVKDPYVFYDDASGEYHLLYAASGSGGGFQVGLASATSPDGPFVKFAGNPIVPRVAGTGEDGVFAASLVKDWGEADANRRYQLLYTGFQPTDGRFRIYLATAPAVTGPWTKEGLVVDVGPQGDFAQDGYSRPRPLLDGGQWTVLISAKSNPEVGEPFRITHLTGPSLDALTPANAILVNKGEGPEAELSANASGRSVFVDDTTGFVADAYVEIAQLSPIEWTQSRIRKVVDATTLELYHGVDFSSGPSAKIVQSDGANRIEIADVQQIDGVWHLYATVFGLMSKFDIPTAAENTGLLRANSLLGPYAWSHLASPPVHRSRWRNEISNENISFLHRPVDSSGGLVDTTAPSVALTAPASGSLNDLVAIGATASDDIGVASVQFQLDGSPIGAPANFSPFVIGFDTGTAPEGTYALTALATDTSGNQATSSATTITIDRSGPATTWTGPPDLDIARGLVALSVDATDLSTIVQVEFFVDGVSVGSATSAPYAVVWDTGVMPDATYTLHAVALDSLGQETTTPSVMVVVDNAGALNVPALPIWAGALMAAGLLVLAGGLLHEARPPPR